MPWQISLGSDLRQDGEEQVGLLVSHEPNLQDEEASFESSSLLPSIICMAVVDETRNSTSDSSNSRAFHAA